ncbi:MAG: dolichol-phosphate mannosyltransferase [Verrucomicrobia bacterium]|jgi:dolichol-phosphate mannosyltransferase|nr:MAG: dolichol-phosphate mannosyltransferase [Verrucomicrobiota bacterium]
MNPTTSLTGRVHVILPAYNEADSLPGLLRRFAELDTAHPELQLRVLVINDGSADATAEVASQTYGQLDVTLHNHERNMGLGQAMLTGLQRTVANLEAGDVIVAMDADDTHDVNLIPIMAERLSRGADVAIASRFVSGGCDRTAPPFRRLLSRGAAVVFRTIFPLESIGDFTSGYRMYRGSLMQNAVRHWGNRLIEEDGFACMVELLLKLRFWGPTLSEVPMVLRYDRKLSVSKLKLMRTLRQYLQLAIRNAVTPTPREIRYASC